MALINLTDPALNIAPVSQSTDVEICVLTFAEPIALDDKLSMFVRETIGGTVISKLTSKDGNFVVDPAARTVSVRLTEKTAKWFSTQTVTEANRVRTLTGTLLHQSAGGVSYPWSGEIDVRFAMSLSWTRD